MFTFDDLIELSAQSPAQPARSTCYGLCVTAADIGVGFSDQVAYPHPLCPEHGSAPGHQYREVRVHDMHQGPVGVCECGAYRDEHEYFQPEAQTDG